MNGFLRLKTSIEMIRAIKGWFIYHWKIKVKGIDNAGICLLSRNHEEEKLALSYLDDWVRDRHFKKVIVISDNAVIEQVIDIFVKADFDIVILTKREMNNLISLWRLYNFNKNFVYASFDGENRENYEVFANAFDMEFDELFAIAILCISKFEKKDKPLYRGMDKDIQLFLST